MEIYKYLDREYPFEPEREREDTDLERDLDKEQCDDFTLGDSLYIPLSMLRLQKYKQKRDN